MKKPRNSRIVSADQWRELKRRNRELLADIEVLKAQRRQTAEAIRTLLNVLHDDDTGEIPF